MALRHIERHRTARIGWLRAAVLGANDGIVSTASLVLGVAAAEYVSVHSQADTENADLARESAELARDPDAEQRELAAIYVMRGLTPALAAQVAKQLMARDALGAHARDELGIAGAFSARPVQAALSSALSFAVGAALPLAVIMLAPERQLMPWVAGTALAFLAALGALAARAGGAPPLAGAWRVTFWGAAAMAATAGVGALVGAA